MSYMEQCAAPVMLEGYQYGFDDGYQAAKLEAAGGNASGGNASGGNASGGSQVQEIPPPTGATVELQATGFYRLRLPAAPVGVEQYVGYIIDYMASESIPITADVTDPGSKLIQINEHGFPLSSGYLVVSARSGTVCSKPYVTDISI